MSKHPWLRSCCTEDVPLEMFWNTGRVGGGYEDIFQVVILLSKGSLYQKTSWPEALNEYLLPQYPWVWIPSNTCGVNKSWASPSSWSLVLTQKEETKKELLMSPIPFCPNFYESEPKKNPPGVRKSRPKSKENNRKRRWVELERSKDNDKDAWEKKKKKGSIL